MLVLADLINRAYEKNAVITAYVYGEFGTGKTSYAMWVAFQVLEDWNKVLERLFFDPKDAIEVMERAINRRQREKIIIMDDAGIWLDKMTWWEREKVAFMKFYNLIRSITAGIIFTTPSEELPRNLLNKIFFRVSVAPLSKRQLIEMVDDYAAYKAMLDEYGLPEYWSLATGYKLRTLPNFLKFVKKEYYDPYPTYYPDEVYKRYEDIRWRAVKRAFEEWRQSLDGREENEREKLQLRALNMLKAGASIKEVAKMLMDAGVPRSTAYRWIKQIREIIDYDGAD
ncbi:hypothetical protein PYJP_04090 [Pyrofollis japonicus]|uniref:helix-turn-helix domain-containing protein n=1 Tax=Pyrofollis japonicus TaxID=3060460 RepID=UPI00295C2993|nr:helix-turn-helix domain-containing protein [Pyrofollis japonicus]BEP17057.1 hypothetical protein PYJP_04090 [Pyrofollis japonicus]